MLRWLEDDDFHTFKGPSSFALTVLGMIAALVSVNAFSCVPHVVAENAGAIGCLDIEALRISYQTRGVEFPEALQSRMFDVATQPNKTRVHQTTCAAEGTEIILDPMRIPHHVLCWSAAGPGHHGFKAPPAFFDPECLDELGDTSDAAELARARCARRRIEGVASRIELARRHFSPPELLLWLRDLGSVDEPLSPAVLLRPSEPSSEPVDWQGNVAFGETSLTLLLQAIESTDLTPIERRIAYEQLEGTIWFINYIVATNTATDAIAERNTIGIDHSRGGVIEPMGGTITFASRGQVLSAGVDDLLPNESRFAVVRTKSGPIASEHITLLSDPTPAINLPLLKGALLIGALLFATYLFVNVRKRRSNQPSEPGCVTFPHRRCST